MSQSHYDQARRPSSYYSQPGVEDFSASRAPSMPRIPFGNPFTPQADRAEHKPASQTKKPVQKPRYQFESSSSSCESQRSETQSVPVSPRTSKAPVVDLHRHGSSASQTHTRYTQPRGLTAAPASQRIPPTSYNGPSRTPSLSQDRPVQRTSFRTPSNRTPNQTRARPVPISSQYTDLCAPAQDVINPGGNGLSRFLRRASSSASRFTSSRKGSTSTDLTYPENSWEEQGTLANEPRRTTDISPILARAPILARIDSLKRHVSSHRQPVTPPQTFAFGEKLIRRLSGSKSKSRPAATNTGAAAERSASTDPALRRGLSYKYRPSTLPRSQPKQSSIIPTKTRNPHEYSHQGLWLHIGTLRGPLPFEYLAMNDVMKASVEKTGTYAKGVKEVRKWLKHNGDRWTNEWTERWLERFG